MKMNSIVSILRTIINSSSAIHIESRPSSNEVLNSCMIWPNSCTLGILRKDGNIIGHELSYIEIVLVLHIVPHNHIKAIVRENTIEGHAVLRMELR